VDQRGAGCRDFAVTQLRIHAVPAIATVVVLAGTAVWMGWAAFAVLAVLIVLEVTFSFDNAAVNAKLIKRLSPFWQVLFMTVGILIAVVLVRFALPVVLVAVTTGLSLGTVAGLIVHDPVEYGRRLAEASPVIDAFGGTFLLMIALGFFLDAGKQSHWLKAIERRLAPLGRYDNVPVLIMLVVALVVAYTGGFDAATGLAVFAAAVAGVLLHMVLDLFGIALGGQAGGGAAALAGMAAFVMFMRLEVLDASFSFDGVIGAFAITSNVVIIAAGLGIGALWVRSLTVHLVRHEVLEKYEYLDHGAHWAIAALGVVMAAGLYGVHLPEAVTGSIGLVFIAAALVSSATGKRRAAPA
jgi:hypothetical protein